MALTERTETKIEIIPPYNVLGIRCATIIERDGVEVSRTYERHTKQPGTDVSGECAQVQTIAAAVWTDEVIAEYNAMTAAQLNLTREGNMPVPQEAGGE
tara:strand:- start:1668 stop:1964 length:297 start_codon:yes stop_codon:yes gene_type:complete